MAVQGCSVVAVCLEKLAVQYSYSYSYCTVVWWWWWLQRPSKDDEAVAISGNF